MREDLSLLVDKQRYSGWTDLTVRQSLAQAAHSFDFSVSEKWGEAKARPIYAGSAASILLGNAELVTGSIDSTPSNYDARQHTLRVLGRSKAGDLVDCSGAGKSYKGQSLMDVAGDRLALFGLSVSAAPEVRADVNKPFKNLAINEGNAFTHFAVSRAYSRCADGERRARKYTFYAGRPRWSCRVFGAGAQHTQCQQ